MLILAGGDLNNITPKIVFDAAESGDIPAIDVLNIYLDDLAIGITNLTNILPIELVVIGGGISKQGDRLLTPLMERLRRKSLGGRPLKVELKIAMLGNDAGIIGAAMLGES